MAGLTNLADICLSSPACTSAGFSQLSHLAASLTALCLDWCSELPACLSLLTGLRCLTVEPTYEESGGEPEEVVALLQAGLAAMHHLTKLDLHSELGEQAWGKADRGFEPMSLP
jgi:hypothetical protein